MLKRRTIVSLCALCALAFSAFAAQSAAAATNGTTAFTCKKKAVEGGAGFSKEHCKTADAVASGAKYEHVAVPENTTTEVAVTSQDTEGNAVPARLKSTISGVEVEFVSKLTHGEGWAINQKDPVTGEHFIRGEGWTTYTEVEVSKPLGKGCKVTGGELKTNKLKGTSAGQGMEGKLEPVAGATFAEFTVEGCSIAALNGKYEVKGSIKCSGDGSTVNCTHENTTAQGTLTLRGQKAGVDVSTTAKGRAIAEPTYTPLAVTTIETP